MASASLQPQFLLVPSADQQGGHHQVQISKTTSSPNTITSSTPRKGGASMKPFQGDVYVAQEKAKTAMIRLQREVASTVTYDYHHARAIVQGIFSEAVNAARREHGANVDVASWSKAYKEALNEITRVACTTNPATDPLALHTVVVRVQNKLSALSLFSPGRVACGQYGIPNPELVEIFNRKKHSITKASLQKEQRTS
eukprot:PhF_6_TR12312/c0_g1_i1/m.19558